MAINPLTKRPQPPGGVPHRAMFFWSGAVGSADPLDTDSAVNSLISFLDELNVGCNTIFLDVWRYLGGSNWTNAYRDRLYAVLDGLKRSGCRVYALAGNVDWGVQHKWVMDNIVEPVLAFNAIATSPSQQFDGIILDVEYWTDETNSPVSTNCPGLCDLVKAIKARAPQLGVGLFLAFFLQNPVEKRAYKQRSKGRDTQSMVLVICPPMAFEIDAATDPTESVVTRAVTPYDCSTR